MDWDGVMLGREQWHKSVEYMLLLLHAVKLSKRDTARTDKSKPLCTLRGNWHHDKVYLVEGNL